MKHASSKLLIAKVFVFFVSFGTFLAAFVLFCSFKTTRFGDEFLKQLGVSKITADEKITGGLLGGGFDMYGIKNAKNIALGNRKAVVLDVIDYAKKQAASPAFVKRYNDMRDRYRQKDYVPQTPDEMRADDIKRAKEAVANMEETYRKADPQFKALFLKNLEDMKKQQKAVEDPAYKPHVRYAKNYDRAVQEAKEMNAARNAEFLRRYPDNHLLYIKVRLQQFLDETKDVDFGAELVTKNGKKYFVNRAYESKGNYWKMAFRAGREAVEPAREAVQKWIDEIK